MCVYELSAVDDVACVVDDELDVIEDELHAGENIFVIVGLQTSCVKNSLIPTDGTNCWMWFSTK